MRIVGGALRGRTIVAPPGRGTRPTTDRVREAIYSALAARLGSDLGGATVLDAFAGSGALGLEALSRGASAVTFVERDRAARATLERNISTLGVSGSCRVVAGDALSLAGGALRGPFGLVVLDPPYSLEASVVASLLSSLAQSDALERGAMIAWEHGSGVTVEWPVQFTPDGDKTYGTTTVSYAYYEGGN